MNPIDNWCVHHRPFAPVPGFVICHRTERADGSLRFEYVQDAQTGADALFPTKADAARALRAILKPAKRLRAQEPRLCAS